jgi:hypothetical protein
MATIWKQATPVVKAAPDTGDILAPLKRVHKGYLDRSLKHELSRHPERAEYYHEQAENVWRLVNQ